VLQVCFISSVSVEVILASSSLQERKRDKDTFGTFFYGDDPQADAPAGESRNIQESLLSKDQSNASQGLGWFVPSFFILLISSPSFSIPPNFFLFNLLDLNERLLLVDIFLFAHSWRGKSWPSISLSMKDYGAASRAAKSPLRTLLF